MANKPIKSLTIPGLSDTYVNNPESIASQFDSTVSYAIGDYAYYDNKLYRFTAAHSGAWAAADVTETTIGDDIVTDVQINGTSITSGGVANVPIGSSTLGVVKETVIYGIDITNDGSLMLISPSDDEIKAGSAQSRRAIQTHNQHKSTFYGLAKAAGDTTQSQSSNAVGVYTETAKSKISEMLNAPVTVSGTTPSITGMAGVRYVCGEVATLSITPPVSGCIDVVFTSGGTPTVLTVPSTVKWVNGFDPDNLDANTVYEINIMDGIYGVAGSWT